MVSKIIKKYNGLPVQVKASFWFLITAFMQRGISVITTPIFTRLLSTSEYGQYSIFNSWLSIATVFVSFNLYYGVYAQGLVKFEEERAVFSSSLQGLSLTFTLVWTAIYLPFSKYWNKLLSLTTVQVLAMLVIIWSTSAFSFWAKEQRVEFKYRKLVLITVATSIAKPVLGIVFVILAEDKVTARILAILLVEVIAYTGLFLSQMRRGKKFYSKKFWKYAIIFNLPLLPHYLANTVLNSIDRIMIGRMVGSSEAGIYNLAYSVSQIMTLFNTALHQTLEPWMYKKIKAKRYMDIKNVAYPALVAIAVVNILLIAFAPEVISIFAPESYFDAIWVVPPIAMSVYFTFSYGFFAVFEFYYEKTSYVAAATMVGAVVNVVLNYIFISIFGYYAAGYTTLICYILYALFHYHFMNKICEEKIGGIRPYSSKTLLKITSAFLIVGFIFLLTYHNNAVRYALIVVIMVVLLLNYKKIINYAKSIIIVK